jgi:HEAT repeat protein
VVALVNLAFDPTRSKTIQLDPGTASALASRYAIEASGRVRAEILKTVALTDADPSTGDTLAASALDDSDPSVVAYAVMAIARSHPPQALPRIVALLNSTDSNVRLQIAQTMSGYGALAAAQLPALRAAAEKEAVPVIKRTLDAAIAAIVAAGGKPARD